ncbi:hypothetical protein HELRODRAFT_164358 [Helobdella robusta]|uniref:DNA-directed RNA polymerase I subunit RPA49 n=1 Tax=Helobdella robusta TaxID=6412 RepID=T1EVB4_HELRO|nr:hypothetical protein HELRODRAFT_164358 [Helobdella robusta]ESN94501.1 hypothetical protein HELRODRAFT_164358 [Helobdella robusta]
MNKDKEENKNKIRDRLIKAFGSTKGKRLIDSRERNAVIQESYESSIGAAINNSKIESNGFKDDDADKAKNSDSSLDYLPKHNLNALQVQDIYPMNQIISDAEMDALATPAIIFTESTVKLITEWSNNKTYPSFICDRLKYLPVDDAARAKKCKQFMYLRYLLFLYSLKYAALRKKEFMPPDIPPLVKSNMVGKFTIPVAGHKFARSIPPKTKDSILFHILVLCLHIDDFSLNVSDLNVDLPGKDLLKYLRLLGCKVTVNRGDKSVKNDAKAILTVPLTFPTFSPSKKNKRKEN